jgi:hypothetical protein
MYWPKSGWMMAVDSSILDSPRTTPIADPKAHLQAAVNWHIRAETGFPHRKVRVREVP